MQDVSGSSFGFKFIIYCVAPSGVSVEAQFVSLFHEIAAVCNYRSIRSVALCALHPKNQIVRMLVSITFVVCMCVYVSHCFIPPADSSVSRLQKRL